MTLKITTLVVVSFSFLACDDDFSTVGGEVIENPSDLNVEEFEVQAYNKKINGVQTNNLTDYLLGVYNDPVYGQTNASILTQLSLSTANPTFGDEVSLDSVVLTVPYYSTEEEVDEQGNTTYNLDSIIGNEPFKISIQESGYFLRDYDPESNFQDRQKYYSNQADDFEQNLLGEVIYENENFLPSAASVVTYEENTEGELDTITSGPALRLKLPVAYFQEKIIDREGSSELNNNNNFRNYLRGLYIKAEPVNNNGSLLLFDLLEEGDIKLFYTTEEEGSNNDEETVTRQNSYALSLGPAAVNVYHNNYPQDIAAEVETSGEDDGVLGAERLFLKGMGGSMAVIKLFEEGDVEMLRQENLMINDASLELYVDKNEMGNADEPERIYIYDLDNNRIVADYSFASQIGELRNQPWNSFTNFSSPLEREEDESGIKYTLSLSQHVDGIINGDNENVRLGLVVVDNIIEVVNWQQSQQGSQITGYKNSALRETAGETVPSPSVISPQGTILHGNLSEDEEKRLKLRVYFTKTRD